MDLLQVKNVTFHYSSRLNGSSFSLEEINFNVSEGEFISIIGPNGSGKSTLLKIISGVISPQKGTVKINEENIHSVEKKKLAKKIAFVPQTFSVAFPFSVFEIVMMGRTPYLNNFGYEKEHDIEIANEALKSVGIYHLKNSGINEVSGGEAQRAFIARALAQDPDILLLDEPNAHLDIEHQIAIFKILEKLNSEKNITILIISHDLNLAGYFGRRILLMKQGKIVMDDSPKKILTEQNIKKIFNINSIVNFNESSGIVSVNIVPK